MTGFLEGLAARARGASEAIAPRIATRFEPVRPFEPVHGEEASVAVPGSSPITMTERVRVSSPPPPAPEPQPSLESRFAVIDRALRALTPSRPRIEEEPHDALPAQRIIERHTERVETASPSQTHQTTHHHTTITPRETHHHTTIAPRETHVVHAAPPPAEETAPHAIVTHHEIVREKQERIVAAPHIIEHGPVLHESKTITQERVRHERVERERVTHERIAHERVIQQQHMVELIRSTAAAQPAIRTILAPPAPAPRTDAASEPSIHISIGRIDVRAQTAPEKRAPSSAPPSRPSLDDYMQRREGRRR